MYVARIFLGQLVLSLSSFCFAQSVITNDSTFLSYLKTSSEFVNTIISDTNYRVQICYSSLSPDDSGAVDVQTFALETNDYFFPASTVKLPIALITLEKLERLGLSLDDVLKINDDVDCGNKEFIRLTQERDLSFRTMIEEMIVVSDNFYYNCLYHFVTPKEVNDRLKELGYATANIYRSFTGCDVVNHLHTNSLEVLNQQGEVLYKQEEQYMNLCDMAGCYVLSDEKKLGVKHEYQRKILDGPFDFNYNLEVSLSDLNQMMLRLVHPSVFNENQVWDIDESNRIFMIESCSMIPGQLKNVKYKDAKKYPDNLYKYTCTLESSRNVKGCRSISKLGLSYGFTTEVAYVLNREERVQFQLSVSIYTNKNRIVNDGKYEYEEVARPFITALTEILTQYEHSLGKKSEWNFEEGIAKIVYGKS